MTEELFLHGMKTDVKRYVEVWNLPEEQNRGCASGKCSSTIADP